MPPSVLSKPALAQAGLNNDDYFETGPFFQTLQHYGYNTHSFLSLYPGLRHFSIPDAQASKGPEGYIPYVSSGKLLLVAGEPVCPPENFEALMQAFLAFAQQQQQIVGLIPVSELTQRRLAWMGFDSLYIGKEPIFNLHALPVPSTSIRQAVRRAERKGLRVLPYHKAYRQSLEALCGQWQQTHELPAMEFLFQLRPLEGQGHKRYFLLVDETDTLQAFLACSPIYGRNGWYLEDLIRQPDTPNGATELLLLRAMENLGAEGYDLATLALAPLAGLPDQDEEHPILNHLLRLSYKHLSFLYHFQSLEYFKAKFKPNSWEKNYFCFYPRGMHFALIYDLFRAFMPVDIPRVIRHKLAQLKRQL